MSSLGEWAYWLLCLGVIAVMAALVYVAWWALFADRARGRRRCPRCWYDMAYAPPPGMTCAECGFTARHEAQFNRTRRRYTLAGGAIMASVTVALIVSERATQRGLTAMLPSRVLVWMLPLADSPQRGIFGELATRAATSKLSQGQWQSLMERCAAGDWRARPISDRWVKKYGEFIWDWRGRLIDDPAIEQPLLAIPPSVSVTSRAVWPRDLPVTILIQIDDWWPWGMECRITATPHFDGAAPATFYRAAGNGARRTPFALALPSFPDSVSTVKIDLQIDRRRVRLDRNRDIDLQQTEADGMEWEPIATHTTTVSTRVEGTTADMMKPVSDAAMAPLVAQVVSGGAVKWANGSSPVRFNIAAPVTFDPAFNGTAIGVSVELRRDGVVARRLNMWWVAGATLPANQLGDRNYGFEIDFENLDLLQQLTSEAEGWDMHVRSNPALALRAGNMAQFWQGEVTVPLRLNTRTGDAPPRPWRTEE